ncbi:MAG: hypothetical protein JJLCMIEE_03428 [Acidimicrobiales bacterium]|nr:hypothetical protein [Acidimicrobiales bacterium]
MPQPISAQPTLYPAGPPGSAARLRGRRCAACGYVFFPPQDFGCERCGAAADQLVPAELKGTGTLLACVTVYFHPLQEPTTPFTVASILLDDGPAIRSLLVGAGETEAQCLEPGLRMQAVLTPAGTDSEGTEIVELRFAPAGPGTRDVG